MSLNRRSFRAVPLTVPRRAEGCVACIQPNGDIFAPPGTRTVKIAEPNVWVVLPNNVPVSVAINAYYHGNYVDDIYANATGCCFQRRCV